jgi:hypothetical protein
MPRRKHTVLDTIEANALRRGKAPMHAAFALLLERQRGATPEEAIAAVAGRFPKAVDWDRVKKRAFGNGSEKP